MAYQFRFEGPASADANQLLRAVERSLQGHLIRVQGTAGPDQSSAASTGSGSDSSASNDGALTLPKCPPVIIGHKPVCYNALIGESPFVIIGHKPLIAGAVALFAFGVALGYLWGRAGRNRALTQV